MENKWSGFNEHEQYYIVISAVAALLGLHCRGIVHRQISPRSFYLNAEGKVILGDLDFSTRLALEDEIGCKIGKPGFLSYFYYKKSNFRSNLVKEVNFGLNLEKDNGNLYVS